jgi:two-component system, NarL family, response regulator LiaR
MTSRIRVVVALAHDATRAGVRGALEEHGVTVCGQAADAPGVVEAVGHSRPDCCLLGTNLPGETLTAVAQISRTNPQVTIIVLADDTNPRELLACIRTGAAGYLPTSMNPDRLGPTVMDACNGGAAIPRRLVGSLVEAVRTGYSGLTVGLPADVSAKMTRRELEVLEMLHSGATTGTIAAMLSISPVTVRRHVSSIVAKLGVADRQAAVAVCAAGQSRSVLISVGPTGESG